MDLKLGISATRQLGQLDSVFAHRVAVPRQTLQLWAGLRWYAVFLKKIVCFLFRLLAKLLSEKIYSVKIKNTMDKGMVEILNCVDILRRVY